MNLESLMELSEPILAVAIIVLATVAVGLLLARQPESKLQRFMPYLISIGTGMFIALCFVEFIPHSMEGDSTKAALLILAGIWFVVFAEKHIAPRLSPKGPSCDSTTAKGCISHNTACTSIGCIMVCAFFDGVEIPAGFAIGGKTGLLMSGGMLMHTIPEGALAASIGIAGGFNKRQATQTVLLVGAAIALGALLSIIASQYLGFREIVLPLTTGVLLYVSIGHLLPITLKSRYGLAGTAAGMLAALALSLGHHHDHHHHDDHHAAGDSHHGEEHHDDEHHSEGSSEGHGNDHADNHSSE